MLGKREMSKNEMIERVRKYALEHGITREGFREIVMDFKAKSRVTGEEFHPRNIFRIIKEKIKEIEEIWRVVKCKDNSDCPMERSCVKERCRGNYLSFFQLESKS